MEYADQKGLVYIDIDSDAVTASNRLLLTYPDLHEVLSVLINQWAESAKNDHFFHTTSSIKRKENMTNKETQAIHAVFDSLVEPTVKWPISSLDLLKKTDQNTFNAH